MVCTILEVQKNHIPVGPRDAVGVGVKSLSKNMSLETGN